MDDSQPKSDNTIEEVQVDRFPNSLACSANFLRISQTSISGIPMNRTVRNALVVHTHDSSDGCSCKMHEKFKSCGQALLRKGTLVYTDATDIHLGQPARDTYYVAVRSVEFEKASFNNKGTNEVTHSRADRMVMGCKVGYLKCQAPDIMFFSHRMGVVTEHVNDKGRDVDSESDSDCEDDGKDGKRAGEFVNKANGYAYVAFVDGNVELFESPMPRKRSRRGRKA
jgi:prepilin-type processing-associated H-X9-DG protein